MEMHERRFRFLQGTYYRELDRRNSLTSALALPIGISTLISSGLLYVAKSVQTVDTRIELAIVAFIVGGAISLACAIFYLCRSYIGYTYQYVPTFSNVRDYRISLRDFYDDKEDANTRSESEAKNYLIDKMALTSLKNFENNNQKSGYIYLANRALVVALLFLLLAVIPVIFSQFELNPSAVIDIIKGKNVSP